MAFDASDWEIAADIAKPDIADAKQAADSAKEAADSASKSAKSAADMAAQASSVAVAANTSASSANATANAASSAINSVKQHFFSDDGGVHVSTGAEQAAGTNNILINALGILLRTFQYNFLSLTRSGMAIYDGLGNTAANIISVFKSDRIELGRNNGSDNHVAITPAKISFLNGDSEIGSFTPSNITLGNQLSNSVSISNSDMAINNAGQKIASFSSSQVLLGENNTNSVISMCGNTTKVMAEKYTDPVAEGRPPSYGSVFLNDGAGIYVKRVHTLTDKDLISSDKKYVGYIKEDKFFINDEESGIASYAGATLNFGPNDHGSGGSSITVFIERTPSQNFVSISNIIRKNNTTVSNKSVTVDADTLIDCLNAAKTSMSDWVYIYGSGAGGNVINTIRYKAINGICYMTFDLTGISTNGWYCPSKLPTQYLPDTASYIGATDYPSGAPGLVWLVSKSANGSGPWFMNTGTGRLVGTISWPYI